MDLKEQEVLEYLILKKYKAMASIFARHWKSN